MPADYCSCGVLVDKESEVTGLLLIVLTQTAHYHYHWHWHWHWHCTAAYPEHMNAL